MNDYDDTIMIIGIDTFVYAVQCNGFYILDSDDKSIFLNKEDRDELNLFLKDYVKDIFSKTKEEFLYTNLKLQVSHLINKYKNT